MTRTRTDDPDTWRVADVMALQGLAPPRSFRFDGRPHPRRVLATLVAFPLALWGLRTALPPTVDASTGWWVMLGVIAVPAALTVATYVPLPGAGMRGGTSPCAAAALVFVVLAALALGSARASALSGIPALALAGLGLGQRLLGAAACPPRTP